MPSKYCIATTHNLDRFSRNRYDSAMYKSKLKKHNVRVVSATENISDDPEGIILEGMLESLSEYYSANLSKHVKRGMRESAMNGTSTGGTPPIGFKYADRRLVVDDDKAPIIRYAFEQYAAGVPKKEIIAELDRKGIRNRFGRPLSMTSFQHALKNRKYIGINIYDGIEVAGGCPRIIDDDTFQRVQERLSAVSRAPAENKAKVEYYLRGKAFCGYCGSRMVGESGRSKGGHVHHYYACAKKKKEHTCKKKNERKDFIEWYVVEQTCLYVLDPARLEIIAEAVVASYQKEFDSGKLTEYERRVAKLDREANTCVDTLLATENAAIKKRLQQKLEDIELQKVDVEIDISKLRIAMGIQYTQAQVVAWLRSFCSGDLMDESFRRRIIDVFINSIYLYDDKVVIFCNLRDGKQTSFIDRMDALDELAEDGPDSGPAGDATVRISNDTACQACAFERNL